jgi:hypothetical protein
MNVIYAGLKYQNIKTGNLYKVLNIVRNANNGQGKDPIVIYQDLETLLEYGRNYSEFKVKFKVTDQDANAKRLRIGELV